MAAPILRAPGMFWFFLLDILHAHILLENLHAHKIRHLGFFFWGGRVGGVVGGGSAIFIFMGAGIS